MKVYLLAYEHKNRTDYLIFASEQAANKEVANIARQNWAHRPFPEDMLDHEPVIMSDEDVVSAYFEGNNREWFVLEPHEVIGAP